MKHKVLVYTPQHTGTWFLIYLLQTAKVESYWTITDGEIRSRGRPDPENLEKNNPFACLDDKVLSTAESYPVLGNHVNDQWLESVFGKYMTEEERQNELIVFHNHIKQPGSVLTKALSTRTSSFPIISSMRDPLLAIQTLVWREYGTYKKFIETENAYTRIGRAHVHVERIMDALGWWIYTFPVDLPTKNRERTESLFATCGLEFSERTEEYIKNWTPQNTTANWTSFKVEHETEPFELFKKYSMTGDREAAREMLSIEFDYLHSRDDLKERLEVIGYNNLIWF